MDSMIYEGFEIQFQQGTKMVNLTNMWRAWQRDEPDAGVILARKPTFWLRQQDTVRFIKANAKKLKVDPQSTLKTAMGRWGGTWAHWQIALAYAKYLSPEFHIWANQVIKERFEEMANPDLGLTRAQERAQEFYRKQGRPEDWIYNRIISTIGRNRFTSMIGRNGAFGAAWRYATATNITYLALFGKTAEKLKEDLGVDNLRDNFDNITLSAINFIEEMVSTKLDDAYKASGKRAAWSLTTEMIKMVSELVVKMSRTMGLRVFLPKPITQKAA